MMQITTHGIVDDLLHARVEERHMHVLARRGTRLEDLPEATVMQKIDFVPAVQRWLALGCTVGILAGSSLLRCLAPHRLWPEKFR